MAALTLIEAAKIAATNGEAKKAGVIALFAEKSDMLNALPFTDISGNALTFTQEGALPTTAFRGVNEAYTANNGVFSPQTESLYMAGGDLDVDMFILKTQGDGVRGKHEGIKVKALAVGVTTQIMSGDTATDARGFDGLQKRITGGQLVANGATSGGDALSLANLDTVIDSVNEPTHIILSRAMRLKFQSAYRTSTFPNIYMTVDEAGKQIWSYAGLPLLVGYPSNSNTKILPFTEANPGGGSAVGTSIYVVSFSEDGVCGIQNGGMDVRDLGELQTAPVKRTRVEWYPGLTVQSPYAAARLYGIKNAAIVA
jgi:hypothetical protein